MIISHFKIWRIYKMRKDLPIDFLETVFDDFCHIRPEVVIMQYDLTRIASFVRNNSQSC